jgi:hypothetical protein
MMRIMMIEHHQRSVGKKASDGMACSGGGDDVHGSTDDANGSGGDEVEA